LSIGFYLKVPHHVADCVSGQASHTAWRRETEEKEEQSVTPKALSPFIWEEMAANTEPCLPKPVILSETFNNWFKWTY
jgi:hypothetical protein